MIPEIEITCNKKKYFTSSVTVEQYQKYLLLMEKNTSDNFSDAMFFNKKILQALFKNEITLAELGEVEAVEFIAAIKAIHFTMQNIITEKLLSVVEVEQVEREKSAFDEYDLENGYEEEQTNENQWKVCGDIVDRIIKIAIGMLKNSYSQCLKEDILALLKHLKFELDTINEN